MSENTINATVLVENTVGREELKAETRFFSLD